MSPPLLNAAMQCILRTPEFEVDTAQMIVFMQSARARGIDVMQTRVVAEGENLCYAVLPSLMPGRTLLLICGTPVNKRAAAEAKLLIGQVVEEYGQADISMMQMLLDPADAALAEFARECGFEGVAELVYLECDAHEGGSVFPASIPLETYTAENHADFAAAIQASYAQTLDCPALNGVRGIEDVIAGHKAAGEFCPKDWFLVRQEGKAAGVMLLGKVPASDAMDLVYIGLAPELRKRGIASLLLKMAVSRAFERGCRRLTTAVDAKNAPAMRLYLRQGMRRTAVRSALVKVIHRSGGGFSTIHPQNNK